MSEKAADAGVQRAFDARAEHERLCRAVCRALALDPDALAPGQRHVRNRESMFVRRHVDVFLALAAATRPAP